MTESTPPSNVINLDDARRVVWIEERGHVVGALSAEQKRIHFAFMRAFPYRNGDLRKLPESLG